MWGFGAAPEIDFKNYRAVMIPASVRAYMSGQFMPPKSGVPRHTPEWSVKFPGNESATRAETELYEDTIKSVINGALSLFHNFKPGDPTLKSAHKISMDLAAFKDYIQIKNQDLLDLVTMDATNRFYTTYFGGYENWRKLNAWLGDQAALANQEMMDQANLLVADMNFGTASVKQKFYREKIVPIANRFSQDDQMFLRDVFLFNVEGETPLEDLVRAIKMISPHLSFADLTPIMQFGMQMVLGNDLGSDALNPKVDKPYYDRNVKQELAEIESKYRAKASMVGRWLPSDTESLLQERLRIWSSGYTNPNDPRYYVCGEVCNKLSQNLINGVSAGITEALGVSATPYDSDAINKRAVSAIQAAITPDMTPDQAVEVGKRIAAQISTDSAVQGGSGGVGLLLLGAGALYLFMKGKNK